MKTYLEQLSSLPESLALKAVTNLATDHPELAQEPCPSVEHALLRAFNWAQSPEGLLHWSGVHYAARTGEFSRDVPSTKL